MVGIGNIIYSAVKKSFPLTLKGKIRMPENVNFDLTNPYILEALPDNISKNFLQKNNGKDLKSVCTVLNKKLPRSMEGFSEEQLQKLFKKAFPHKTPSPLSSNNDALIYVNQLPVEIGSKYDAHGISKFSIFDDLRSLNNLLSKGIDKNKNFYTAPLIVNPKNAAGLGAGLGTSGGSAYKTGSFIILGEESKPLTDGIKHVIVNDTYYNIISDLQKKFPDVNFIRADEVLDYFTKSSGKFCKSV